VTTYPFRSALVTGASSGIGEEIVRLLGEARVPTVVVARREDRLVEIAERHEGFEVLAADLTTSEGIRSVEQRLGDPERPVDLVVNNAGFGTSGLFHELDVDRLEDEIALNVTALTRIAHAALGSMVPRRRGWLLNVSSVASYQAAPRLATYAATKAFVTSLSESLHEEVRRSGVRVTALCPGLTRTEFQSVSNTEGYQQQYPSLAWCDAADVASIGLRDVARGRATSVPGAVYKGLVGVSQVTPRALVRRISAAALRRPE
jgi:uncharacterized protein